MKFEIKFVIQSKPGKQVSVGVRKRKECGSPRLFNRISRNFLLDRPWVWRTALAHRNRVRQEGASAVLAESRLRRRLHRPGAAARAARAHQQTRQGRVCRDHHEIWPPFPCKLAFRSSLVSGNMEFLMHQWNFECVSEKPWIINEWHKFFSISVYWVLSTFDRFTFSISITCSMVIWNLYAEKLAGNKNATYWSRPSLGRRPLSGKTINSKIL